MSLVKVLKAEMQAWRSAWQQIETFLDRIDSARESDRPNADKMRAMLRIVAAIEEERRIRAGTGFDVPLEIAEQREGIRKTDELGAPSLYAFDVTPETAPAFKRLPGAYDVELSVAPLKGLLNDRGELKAQFARYADLLMNPALFRRFDDKTTTWIPVIAPDYDFGAWTAADEFRLVDIDYGLFPNLQRVRAAQQGFADPDDLGSAVLRWTNLRDTRRSKLDPAIADQALIKLLPALIGAPQDDQLRQAVKDAAQRAGDACAIGATLLATVAQQLQGEVFPELDPSFDFCGTLTSAAADLSDRAQKYGRIRSAASSLTSGAPLASGLTPIAELTSNLALVQGYGDVGASLYAAEGTAVIVAGKVLADGRGAAGTVLDEAIAARIEYPDGTLRILRMLEWTFNRSWNARLLWFNARRARYLDPLLVARFLASFLESLVVMYASLPDLRTGTSFRASLAEPAPLVTNARSIKLAPRADSAPHSLESIRPGEVAVIQGNAGERRALAVILGVDVPAGGFQRLRVSPLRISMSGKLPPPAVAGMITQGTLDDGPVALDGAGLLDGTARGAPGDDGVAEELVALWSRLCLLLGGEPVRAALRAARPGSSGELPTSLQRDVKLPVDGALAPHAQRLVLRVEAMKLAGLDLDSSAEPVVARPGELLLVAGSDDDGQAWQGVVEVLSIVRTTPDKVNDDPVLPPMGAMICCRGPGSVIVVQVKDTPFPVALTSDVTLSRDFQGFGAPSLATSVLLPGVIDPRNSSEEVGPYRGPELKAACDILADWIWQPPA